MPITDKKIWRMLIEKGQPPEEGALGISAGIHPILEVLGNEYLDEIVGEDGDSADKLVVGVYGSGKTHFLRAAGDLARSRGFFTSYVALTSVEDYEDVASLAREILCGLGAPDQCDAGEGVLPGLVARLRKRFEVEGIPDPDFALEAWRQQLGTQGFPHLKFSRVLGRTLEWMEEGGEDFDLGQRWLLGELPTSDEAKRLGVQTIRSKQDRRRHGRELLFSWLQLIRSVGVPGTCILLDEAERALNVRGKAQERALGVMRTLGDSILSGEPKATLILMAVTPEVIEGLQRYQALGQRYDAVGGSFSRLNPYSPKIDLNDLPGSESELLLEIGERLLHLAGKVHGDKLAGDGPGESLRVLAEEALRRGPGDISLRRVFVRSASTFLERAARERRTEALTLEEAAQHYDGTLKALRQSEAQEVERD